MKENRRVFRIAGNKNIGILLGNLIHDRQEAVCFPTGTSFFNIIRKINRINSEIIQQHPFAGQCLIRNQIKAQKDIFPGIFAEIDGFMKPSAAFPRPSPTEVESGFV